ncbi:PRC-barrel domain containing protein [Streptomyces sp. NPDC046316]|uniref:PRC-barrel domain containing protein n=1 Tax=Streptomyces sp. NPDC046316 TaxID=3154494 RepID=UPI0034089E90
MTDDLWSYGRLCGHVAGTDLTGWRVEAGDGHVGEVDEHADEVGDAFLVLDAGTWIFGKLLIPAGAVTRIDAEERTIHLGMSKEQVEDAPQFLSDKDRADPQYREDVVAYYRKCGPCP